MNTLIYNVRFAGREAPIGWVQISGDKIARVGEGQLPSDFGDAALVDGEGALLLPGVIDCHVHFREPGLVHKADIASESRAAIAGGVTSYIDMPNTKPATTTIAAWQQKEKLAEEKSAANYAFFIGATSDNIDQLLAADYTRVAGVKLFMGSSTGNMLVDDADAISKIFKEVDAIIAVHAEDQTIIDANVAKAKAEHPDGVPIEMHSQMRSSEACYASTAKAVSIARKYSRRLHICHITSAAELQLLSQGPISEKLVTSEVSPHHLLWCSDDYAQQGTRIKMNPAVKSGADRQALRQALESGLIDMVATDHAPHLLSEKQGDALTATSGAPLVQFSLPLMLTMFDETLVRRTMCENPGAVYRIDRRGRLREGYYADLTLVRKVEPYAVSDADVLSKCGWTPLDGVKLEWRVEKTWVNGQIAYDKGKFSTKFNALSLTFNK